MPMPSSSPSPPVYATPGPGPQDFPTTNGPPASATGQPTSGSSTAETPLSPGDARVRADRIYGNLGPTGTMTAVGHVDLRDGDVDVLSDQAVYDGSTKLLQATGHVRFVASDGDTASADSLEYDARTRRITMLGVSGQSAALVYQGEQIHGALYYTGRRVTVDAAGRTLIQNGSVSTCDPHHVAYHISGREIEIRPGDRLIAHSSDLFLGRYLVAALGVLVIPLAVAAERKPSAFAPRIGYNSTEGVFVRNFLNFYHGPNYYGTYHLDFFQKVGLGFGADAFFSRLDGRGGGAFSFYEFRNNKQQQFLTGSKSSFQVSTNLQEMLTKHVTGALQFNYSGAAGVLSSIPPQTSANLNVTHTGDRSTTSYGATIANSGPSSSFGGIFNHTISFSPTFNQNVSLSLQDSSNPLSFSRTVSVNTDTHYSAKLFDADLAIATTHGRQISDDQNGNALAPVDTLGFQRVPELTLRGRPFEIASLRLPVSITMTDGVYNDGYDAIKTERYETAVQVGSAFYRLGKNSDLTASASLRQDVYGTGDQRGSIGEQLALHTLIGSHADNTVSYQDQSVRGFTPLTSFDLLTGFDLLDEALNVYNGSIYRFTAATNYDFRNKLLGDINYQLNVQPNPYASVSLGTSYDPHGTGYSPLVVALATPLSRNDYLEFSGNYDFKLHGLQGQSYFLSHTVNDCYQVRVAYRQPLKEVDVSLNLLAFPSQSVNFGINNSGPIIPQNLNF